MSLTSRTGTPNHTSLRVRFFAFACIVTLLSTQFILPVKAVVFASGRTATSAPNSAPAEPFLVGGDASTVPTVVGFVASTAKSVASVFASPKVPEGLTVTPPPSIGERAVSGLGSLLAFVTPSVKSNSNAEPQPMPTPSGAVPFDFDNDGKADIGRWQASTTEFKVKNSNGGSYSTAIIGSSGSTAAPGDFDGDHKTDAAVFSAGTWNIKKSSNGASQTITFGTSGDIPVAGDYS